MDLKCIGLITKLEKQLPFSKLKEAYEEICIELNLTSLEIKKRTNAENLTNREVKKYTRLSFERSIWIGNNNYDFFFPTIGGKRTNQKQNLASENIYTEYSHNFRGLVLEINGSIHYHQFKMKQDEYKLNFLHNLRIISVSCDNENIKEKPFQKVLANLNSYPRLDSRAKKRLLRDIYLVTIIKHAKPEFLIRHFGENAFPLWKKLTTQQKQLRQK